MDNTHFKTDIRKRICEIISEMLDNPDKYGIYPTTKCYDRLEQFISDLLAKNFKEITERYEKNDYIKTVIDNAIKERDKEWLSCLPEKGIQWMQEGNKPEKNVKGYTLGFNACREEFLKNAKAKKLI